MENETIEIPIVGVSIEDLCKSERFSELDRNEAYLHALQDEAKLYDWDGRLVSDGMSPIQPGWEVPMAQRRPCARYDLAKVIVSRFTALLFGTDRFPELLSAGDRDSEDYYKGLAEAARLPLRAISARNIGGSQGSVGMSFAFVNGVPKVEVHKPKHIEVLGWRDRSEFRPSAVLKAYAFPTNVFDPETKKIKRVEMYYVRLWTEQTETVWKPIPSDIAKLPNWSTAIESTTVVHGLGFCPFYWTQNIPDEESIDGRSDYDGLHGNLDEMNRLTSAGVRAVKANSDPTLIVKEDPAFKSEHLRKGNGAAIFSRGGADYLTLPGESVDALRKVREDLRSATLDVASVVTLDPEGAYGSTAAAQSGTALRILFAPMTAQADIYREQYGEMLIKPLLKGMFEAAEIIEGRGERVVLPPRVESSEDGTSARIYERRRGPSDALSLNWNPYFPPSWTDIKSAIDAMKAGNGDKPVMSQRTSIAAVQSITGVDNVDEEMAAIQEDAARAMEVARASMDAMGPTPAPLDRGSVSGAGTDPSTPDDDEDELEDSGAS